MKAPYDGGEEQRERVQWGCVEDVGDHMQVNLPVNKDISELLPGKVCLSRGTGINDQALNSQFLLLVVQEACTCREIG